MTTVSSSTTINQPVEKVFSLVADPANMKNMQAGILDVRVTPPGVVPSSFRIARQLLDRLEDSKTGRILPKEFHCEIPAERVEQARKAGEILGASVYKKFPFAAGTQPMVTDFGEAILNRTWRPYGCWR